MVLKVTVTRVEEARTGISANGLPYCRRSIVVAFQEGAMTGQTINQALTVDLTGEDAQRSYVQFQQVELELFFSVSNYKGKNYQNIRATVVQQQQPQMQAPTSSSSNIFGSGQ